MSHPRMGHGLGKHAVRVGMGLLLTGLLAPITPRTTKAQSVSVRIYDGRHHDYHNWDDREDRAYRRYLAEKRWQYREYQRQSARRQRAYWAWRHEHPGY